MARLVVKIGSNILADPKEGLDTKMIAYIARDISELHDSGYEIVIVSSGAVAAGMRKLGLKEKPKDVKLKQAAAAVGQSSLMWAYERSCGGYGMKVAQVLLTRDDFSDRKRYINSKMGAPLCKGAVWYLPKIIPHFKHLALLSDCTKLHFGHFIRVL